MRRTQFSFNLTKGFFDFKFPPLQFCLRFVKTVFYFTVCTVEGDGIYGVWSAHCTLHNLLAIPKFLNHLLNPPFLRQDVKTGEAPRENNQAEN